MEICVSFIYAQSDVQKSETIENSLLSFLIKTAFKIWEDSQTEK